MSDSTVEVEILQGSETEAADILRCLETLYGSRPGELATDRDFGIDTSCLDRPIPEAVPLLVAELTKKTAEYEPRAQVVQAKIAAADSPNGKVKIKVVVELV